MTNPVVVARINLSSGTTDGARILVGVCDAQTGEIIHKTLDDAAYLTSVVRSGKEAISQFVLNHFDLVLIDVMMPDMSGFETGYMIRSLTGNKGKTPIVALTASSDPSIRAGLEGMPA